MTAAERAALPHPLKLPFGVPNTICDQAVIQLELSLPGTTHADTTLLPIEVGPAADQPRGHVPQLRQLDLQLALMGACALRKDIDDQLGSAHQAPLQTLLDVAFLCRAQVFTEQHNVGVTTLGCRDHFFQLALGEVVSRVRACQLQLERLDDLCAGRARELCELVGMLAVIEPLRMHNNHQRPGAGGRSFK